jgi:hypothetical protein
MSEWQGFDPRKVCPNCGGYQTSFWKSKRGTASAQGRIFLGALLLITVFLLILMIAASLIKHVLPEPYQLIGLFFTACLGLGQLLKHYLNSRNLKRELSLNPIDPHRPSIVYRLACSNCGYR